MNAAEAATRAAQQRRAMLARLQPVKNEARSRLGELRAQAQTMGAEAQELAKVHELTAQHGNDLFITPKELAARMVDLAGITAGQSVLEPSAGTGRLADAIAARGASPECVEFQVRLVEHLRKRGYLVHQGDFMQWEPRPALAKYDAAIMNPPFSGGADADHIQRAYEFVKDGGALVAIAGEGIFFRGDRKATAFREWLDAVGGTSERLSAGTFSQSGTNANTRLVIIRKRIGSNA